MFCTAQRKPFAIPLIYMCKQNLGTELYSIIDEPFGTYVYPVTKEVSVPIFLFSYRKDILTCGPKALHSHKLGFGFLFVKKGRKTYSILHRHTAHSINYTHVDVHSSRIIVSHCIDL